MAMFFPMVMFTFSELWINFFEFSFVPKEYRQLEALLFLKGTT
jgi:uncharacterized protein YigE (DUF2233 family)